MAFTDITYWDEVSDILNYARKYIVSTLGICWGGMALAKILGIPKTNFEKKLFGVFRTKNLDLLHPITGDLDDFFYCPQSRHAGYSDEQLEAKRDEGEINLMAHSKETGYTIFETTDSRFLAHLGHPEYNSGRLSEEYYRDKAKGRDDVGEPANFNPEAPVNSWRSHRTEFFSQWIKYIYKHAEY
ncbi:MAG: homoserine O-succinyltransferase, partial [SAR324 cluster bacterium]|nr:homoserine O-succinyltransferase [SAR324 cluster bacterium]